MSRRTTWLVSATTALVLTWGALLYWQARNNPAGDLTIAAHRPACELLTTAEIQNQFHRSVGYESDDEDGESCFWALTGVSYGPQDDQFVGVHTDYWDSESYDQLESEIKHPQGETVRRISDGNRIVLLEALGKQRRLFGRVGKHIIEVYASDNPTGAWNVAAEMVFMREELSRANA